jgi:hypothetical protein
MTDRIKNGKIKVLFLFISLLLPYSANADNSTLKGNIGNSDMHHLPNDSLNRTSNNDIKGQDMDQATENNLSSIL